MYESFVGCLMLVPYNFAPRGWALCQGQLLQIRSNTALFSLIGTYYGGDGVTTFALPDLRGALPVSQGQGPGLSMYTIGQSGGAATVKLGTTNVPAHSHTIMAADKPGSSPSPGNAGLGEAPVYGPASQLTSMNPNLLPPQGAGAAHNNMMPYLGMNWIIALQGIFPSRN